MASPRTNRFLFVLAGSSLVTALVGVLSWLVTRDFAIDAAIGNADPISPVSAAILCVGAATGSLIRPAAGHIALSNRWWFLTPMSGLLFVPAVLTIGQALTQYFRPMVATVLGVLWALTAFPVVLAYVLGTVDRWSSPNTSLERTRER